jgi:hypothetical protein
MDNEWLYSHNGKVEGPFSAEEMRERVADGRILQEDLVWIGGSDPKGAVPAWSVLIFPLSPAANDSAVAAKTETASETSLDEQPAPQATAPAPTQLALGPAPPTEGVPDWLPDIYALQTLGPMPGPTAALEVPEWLEDLRVWVTLDLCNPADDLGGEPAGAPASVLPLPPQQGVPDWLAGWKLEGAAKPSTLQVPTQLVIEQWEREAGLVPTAAAPAPADIGKAPESAPPGLPGMEVIPVAEPIPPAQIEMAEPIPPAEVEVSLGQPIMAPDFIETIPLLSPNQPSTLPPPTKAAVVASLPQAATPGSAPTSGSRAEVLAGKTVLETGFDPRTGKIVNPDKFHEWKKAKRSSSPEPGMTNASTFEVFRKARTEIEHWVDDEKNRLRIIHADWEEIRKNPAVQEVLNKYTPYGAEMREKLVSHLKFLVGNRRQFYLATRTN